MSRDLSRRGALRCLGLGAGLAFSLEGGVLSAAPLSQAAKAGLRPLFVQISDTHIGFSKPANPDVEATLGRAIDQVNALPRRPALVLHTGDITHLSKPEQFDRAGQLLARLGVSELHATPGEHDVIDGPGAEFFARYGRASNGRGYYGFDHSGVHFICLVNVIGFKAGGLGALGAGQLAWLEDDLRGRSASQPLVVFAHMPLWSVYPAWGWGTDEADPLLAMLRRFGSVTVLNGRIHQIVSKLEGGVTFHTARSTAYPQPAPGDAAGPGPLTVPADELPRRLGLTSVSFAPELGAAVLDDATLA